MRYTEQVFSAGKKSGKTGLAAMMVIYAAAVLAGPGGEIYLLANDVEQAQSRVYKAISLILQASPLLKGAVEITQSKIVFRSTGTAIIAMANEFKSFSGANPSLNVYDELAYYNSENARRMFDEGVPSPARRISFRLSVSTAGFDGEPSPLRDLYDRAMERGEQIAPDLWRDGNLLCYWTHEIKAPWQRPEWVEEMRRSLRPAQFARLILNRWVSSESAFLELEDWDAITDAQLMPLLAKSSLPIWIGLDLGLRHDSTAIVSVAWDGDRIRLVDHKIFTPAFGQTLDVEGTAEVAVMSLRARFAVQSVYFDPWQALSVAQRLTKRGVKMVEWPQTPANLGLMAGNLMELIKRRQFAAYPAADLRVAVSKTIAIESARGYRLGKAKASDRVDPIIALAMACIGCVQAGNQTLTDDDRRFMKRAMAELSARPLGRNSLFRPGGTEDRLFADGQALADKEDRQDAHWRRLERRFNRRMAFP
jgi:phage terminase large subunit-like protein